MKTVLLINFCMTRLTLFLKTEEEITFEKNSISLKRRLARPNEVLQIVRYASMVEVSNMSHRGCRAIEPAVFML